MKIAFLDFEFGQIYGSYRRDFIVTEIGVVIYDTKLDTIKFGELIFSADINLVMRKRDPTNYKKTIESVINYKKDKYFFYDKKYKIPKKQKYTIRSKWNQKYADKLTNFLNNTIRNVDAIYLFGGREDINILNRYRIYPNNILDIQTQLFEIYKVKYSLDLVVKYLGIEDFFKNDSIESINYKYDLPKKSKKIFQYDEKNFKAHCALGDSIRLFLVYKELF